MRYIFAALLLMNVGYFGYQWLGQGVSKESSSSPVPRPVEGVSPITLLGEINAETSRTADLNEAVNNPVRAEQNAPTGLCSGVGPFDDVFSGQDVLEQMDAMDIKASLKAVDTPTGSSDYRVMIPPATSAEDAFRKLRELQASDIDSYVITQGEQALGISLGVFSTLEAANTLRDRLRNIGYLADIVEIERMTRAYWLFLAEETINLARNWTANRGELSISSMTCPDP